VASLIVALIMRRRHVSRDYQTVQHNLPLTVVGGAFIIMGWYGFNGGSALAANHIAATAVLNTHLTMWYVG
jgi:ammonium transporter, Amt family